MAMLPPDRFPNLTTVGAEMARGGAGDRSEFALELLLRGLATFVAGRQALTCSCHIASLIGVDTDGGPDQHPPGGVRALA